MSSFDRRVIVAVVGLTVLLLGMALWVTRQGREDEASRPTLLYVVGTSTADSEVWQWDWERRQARRVAQLPGAVLERAEVPGTGQVVYPVERMDGGRDLWLVDVHGRSARRWLDCAPDDCSAPAADPEGRGIVYTRISEGAATLWQVAYDSGVTAPLFGEETVPGHHAAWSPDGSRLAYTDPGGRVCVVGLESTFEPLCVGAVMESAPVWSPDGEVVLVTDLRLESGAANHILAVDAASGTFVDLSDASGVEDDAPAWSPDGEWIAFRRRVAGTAMGKQLWVMRADGRDARPLTSDTASYYGPPVWGVDGETLLVTRHAADSREIWEFSTASATGMPIVSGGYLPLILEGDGQVRR